MAVGSIRVADVVNLTPDVWSAQFIETLRTRECLSKYVTVDSSLEVAKHGTTVKFGVPNSITIADKTPGSVYTLFQAAPSSPISLTMNYHRACTFIFEDPAELAALQGTRNYYIEDSVGQIIEDVNAKIAGLYASFAAIGTNPDLSGADLLLAIGSLDNAKVPDNERVFIIHPNDKVNLINDPALTNWFLMGGGQSATSTGKLPDLYGASAVQSPQVPLATNRKNLLLHKRAIGFGCRSLPPVEAGLGAVSVIRYDPETGLVIRIWTAFDTSYGGIKVVVECLYGVIVLDANRGRLLPGSAS